LHRKVEHYQQMAAECLRVARTAVDQANKAVLLEMAQNWVRLAEQVKAARSIELPETRGL
jgi:hypothetical protein